MSVIIDKVLVTPGESVVIVAICLIGFLTSSSTTRRTGPKIERLTIVLAAAHETEWETMTSVSAGQIRLTPTQPVGSGRLQRESNPGRPHQESRALPTELPTPDYGDEAEENK